jgi:excisionase family DNA binding protein
MNTPTQNDTLLDVTEAAKLAKVCQRTVWNWLESKSVSCIRMGRVVRFDRATFLSELRAFSTPVAGRRS